MLKPEVTPDPNKSCSRGDPRGAGPFDTMKKTQLMQSLCFRTLLNDNAIAMSHDSRKNLYLFHPPGLQTKQKIRITQIKYNDDILFYRS